MATKRYGFDPYRVWLGIPANRRPPTHYDILSIQRGESDPDVIRSAAEQRRNYIESKRGTGHDEAVFNILQQIDDAVATLLVPEAKAEYDRMIRPKNRRKSKQSSRPLPAWFQSAPGRIYGEGSGIVTTFAGIMAVIVIGIGVMVWMSAQLPWAKLTTPGPDKRIERPSIASMSSEPAMETEAVDVIAPEEGLLEELMPGHEAKVEYHKDLAVITKIDAAGDPAVPKLVPSQTVQPVDLLQLIEPNKHSVKGRWEFRGGRLSVIPNEPIAKLLVPYKPPDAYELTVVIIPYDRSVEAYIGLVANGRQFQVVLDGHMDFSGLNSLGGSIYRKNETAFRGPILSLRNANKVVCRVGTKGVTVTCNGRTIIEYSGDIKRLDLPSEWIMPEGDSLFLGAYEKRFDIVKMSLLPYLSP